jgi:hypothetical protein
MTAVRPAGDGGFALVEALFAAGLLALAGTVATLVGMNLLRSQDDALRRSSALVTLDMMAKVARSQGIDVAALLAPDDENFRYVVLTTPAAAGAPVPVRIEAHPRDGAGAPHTLDLVLAVEPR